MNLKAAGIWCLTAFYYFHQFEKPKIRYYLTKVLEINLLIEKYLKKFLAIIYTLGMKTTDRRFIRTEKALTKAMVELLNKDAIRNIGIDDLIRQADVNRSTLYLHYRSVEDVLRTLENELIAGLASCVDSRHNSYDQNIDGLLTYVNKNKKLAYAVFSSRSKTFLDNFEEFIKTNFYSDFVKSKKNRVNEKEMLVYSKIDSFDTIIRLWVTDGCKMKKEEVALVLKKIHELS